MGTVAEGLDTWCTDSLQPGRYARGLELVAQRCYRRLITPPGTLLGGEDEADFGVDLPGLIGSTASADVDAMLPVRVRNELRKDPSVVDVTVDASRTESGGQVSWTLSIVITTTGGDVSLIVGVDSVSVDLLGVR